MDRLTSADSYSFFRQSNIEGRPANLPVVERKQNRNHTDYVEDYRTQYQMMQEIKLVDLGGLVPDDFKPLKNQKLIKKYSQKVTKDGGYNNVRKPNTKENANQKEFKESRKINDLNRKKSELRRKLNNRK